MIIAGARSSPLSQVQVKEVREELVKFHPSITIQPIYLETLGDKDKISSLRNLEKSDFFTKEIDALLLSKRCQIGIHSAKDLPDPLPQGITLAAITRGVDPRDALVLRAQEDFYNLPPQSIIATSSLRREEVIKALRRDLLFRDLRGTIHERLSLLNKGRADGVVIAEAALIRLNLTHLNRFTLPGETAPLQGKLAITCLSTDNDMLQLFSCLDTR